MPTQKIDPKVIFASNAPAVDKPPVFSDKTKGWDVARANDGRPEIKEMNKVQQDTDLKILWLNENSVTPYDESIDYPDGAVVLKDGSFKQLVDGIWELFLGSNGYILEYFDSSKSYPINARIMLVNGDIVKSTLDGNANDPNVDMTGWINTNDASQVKYGKQNQAQINSRTATPYDHGAIGDGLAHPLSERYTTLVEAQAVYPFATSLDEYIDGHALNAWWQDICANNRNFATCHGQFVANTKISNAGLNDPNNLIKTKHVDFAAQILFDGVTEIIENGFEIISPRQMQFSGELEILDSNTTWANRKVNHLIYMEDLLHGKHTWKVVCRNARKLGLRAYSGASSISGVYANNNTSDLGSWQFTGCGHRFSTQTFSFTSRSDTGASDSQNQRSVLTLSAPHGLGDLEDSFIRYKGRPYWISSSTEDTLSVYPWLIETDATGTFEISTGGDFRLDGADSNLILMSTGASNCAICSGKEGFYIGAKIQSTNEFNDIGFKLGGATSGIQIGGTYLGRYMEGNEFDIVGTSNSLEQTLIINPVVLDYSKCFFLAPLNPSREYSVSFQSAPTIIDDGKIVQTKRFQNTSGATILTNIRATAGEEFFKLRASSPTVTLTDAPKMRELFGHTDVEFEIFGFASNNGTSGNTTIKCDTGYTINGSASDLVVSASNAAFRVSARLVSKTDWRVYVFYAERPKGSKTHDWASLAAGVQQSTTVTVYGAVVGNAAVASMDVALNGTSLRAEVTASNMVTIYHHNPTTAAVDVASGTLFVKLI